MIFMCMSCGRTQSGPDYPILMIPVHEGDKWGSKAHLRGYVCVTCHGEP